MMPGLHPAAKDGHLVDLESLFESLKDALGVKTEGHLQQPNKIKLEAEESRHGVDLSVQNAGQNNAGVSAGNEGVLKSSSIKDVCLPS